ncbi:MAG: hypothetical protein K2X81_22490, partial [Candidatus Obscuribacterales bacterium]|nr:hypothetical protein [Candidatus Obscuribacterales bacterium]
FKNQFWENAYPIYRIYSDTVRDVLQILLDAGFKDICGKHAELIEVDAWVQTNPTQHSEWALINEQGKGEFFPIEDFSKSDMLCIPNLVSYHPEIEHVKNTQIRFFTFDPSSGKAIAASKRVYWDQLHDPAVVWHYFESALWCWNTPGSYFEDRLSPSEREKDVSRFYHNQAEHARWREISKLQGDIQDNNRIVVFTERFFKEGLKTLINAIAAFVAEEAYKVEAPPKVMEEAIFELFWQCDQLWISIRSSAWEEKFCIQKFKDFGYPDGSEQQKFCRKLVEALVDVQAPYKILFDRMAHVLERLKLPPILKKRYFGTAQRDSVSYQGPKLQISLESNELTSLIQELQAIHNSN